MARVRTYILWVVLIILVSLVPAFAAPAVERDPKYGIERPPIEFRYAPPMPVVEVRHFLPEVDRLCRQLGLRDLDARIWGCAVLVEYPGYEPGARFWRCIVLVPMGVQQDFIDELRIHEYAHCNGYKHG